MNRDDIIRMAREAGLKGLVKAGWIENLERFAAAAAAAEAAKWAKGAKISVPTMTMEQEFTWHRNKGYEQGKALIPAAVAAEREACARYFEEREDIPFYGRHVAAAIRKRGE